MMKIKIFKKFISLILAGALLFQPFFGVMVLAEGEITEPQTVAENTQTGTDSSNQAAADAEQTTSVQNENTAVVENNVEVIANSGNNSVTSEPMVGIPSEGLSPTPTPDQGGLDSEQAGEPIPNPTPSENLVPSPTLTPEISEQISPSPTPQLASAQSSTESGVVAENQETGENSENTALASAEQSITVVNNNQTELDNTATVSAETGSNQAEGDLANIQTSEATAEANLVNVVNTNLVGSDFWQVVINLFSTSENDIDLTQIEGFQNFDPSLISILAKNENTGDNSFNIALANFLTSFSVYNQNEASLTNNIGVNASTGGNQVGGDESEIQTGTASAELNFFNLVNTNITGRNWFFGIFNLFKQLNGDLVLPYELQYLLGEGYLEDFAQSSAVNQNTGDSSQNQSSASSTNSLTIDNNNDASLKNNISVSANSGGNEIVGSGSIETGNAQAIVNLMNVINTNIYGSRWLLLAINNFGDWQGSLLGWWGNTITIGRTTYAWIKLPNDFLFPGSTVMAENQNTGTGSTNQTTATQEMSLLVQNNNTATVENNISVSANSGDNQVIGEKTQIDTGEAKASANIINIVNTNIIGNNWFFGMVNIFDSFFGNIIFPRPDLAIVKTVDNETVAPGGEITYAIGYKNQGRLWAKNVRVEDFLSEEVDFVSASDDGALEGRKVIWNFGKIWPGQGKILTLKVKVKSEVADGTIISNNVLISTITDEPNKENNWAGVDVIVRTAPLVPTSTPTPTLEPTEEPTITPAPSAGGEGGVGGGWPIGPESRGGVSFCTPPEAPKAPSLVSATNISSTEVKLVWTKVDRATHYLISYGDFPGHYIYGNPDVGNSDSYIVGSLNAGKTYYFVVAAVIGGDCPVAGPYSNELANSWGLGGEVFGVSQVFDEGEGFKYGEELGGGISTEAGEVAGVVTKGNCPFWWIVLVGQVLLLGGFYGFLLRKTRLPRFWWVGAPMLVVLAYLLDRYAHTHWYVPSRMCPWEKWLGILLAVSETTLFRKIRKTS